MYPVIFSIGDFDIRTYWVMVFMGIIAGFIVLYITTKKFDLIKRKKLFIFAAVIFIPFYIGSRLGYVIESFIYHKPLYGSILIGPNALWWGLVTATVSAFFIAKKMKLNVWESADIYSVSIAAGAVFVRQGCFFNGCCFGKPCPPHFPFAVYFPSFSYASRVFPHTFIYPTELYSSFVWFIIFMILLLKIKRKKFEGELIILMSLFYSVFRFFIEFIRFHEKEYLLSTAQVWCIVIFVLSIVLYYLFLKKLKIKKNNN